MGTFLMIALMFVGLFLILLILVQKGRGGGLAGAFGGAGGQSAFGTKAGDVFTKITIVTATLWIVLAALTVVVMANAHEDPTGQFKDEIKVEGDLGEQDAGSIEVGEDEFPTLEATGDATEAETETPADTTKEATEKPAEATPEAAEKTEEPAEKTDSAEK